MPLPFCTTMHPFLPLYSHCHTLTLLRVLSLSPTTSLCLTLFSCSLSLCQSLSLSHLPLPFPPLSLMQSSTSFLTAFSPDLTPFLATLCSFLQPHALFLQPHVQFVSQPYACFSTHTFSLTIFLSTPYFLCIHALFLVHYFPFLACSCSLMLLCFLSCTCSHILVFPFLSILFLSCSQFLTC